MTVVIEAALAFLVVLGILVLIHEFGHFATAKLLGVRVEAFSVGFGPRLFGVRRGDTDYRVSAIPLGGYVKMTGEEPHEVAVSGGQLVGAAVSPERGLEGSSEGPAVDPGDLATRPRWQRFLVFVMGALLNIVLAVVVMAVVFYRTGASIELPKTAPVVKEVTAGSPAERAGIKPGDRIVQIEGKDARDPSVMVEEIFLSPGTEKTLLVARDGTTLKTKIAIESEPRYHSGETGMKLAFDDEGGPPTADSNPVEEVRSGSPAEKAGLKAGDRIVAIGGRELPGRSDLVTQIRSSAGKPVALGVLRGDKRLEIEVVPESVDGAGQIGIAFPHPHLTIGQSFAESVRYNLSNASVLFVTLKKLVRFDVSPRVMSGPGEIAAAARQAARSGIDPFLHFLAFVSLQLGIINLLPIPMLDGGHVFILLVEGVIRRDLSAVLKERVMQAGLVFLLLFAGVVIYFDIVKLAFS